MSYQDTREIDYENSLTYPDKQWITMFIDDEDWTEPTTDRYEAEQVYWNLKDSGENVEFGFVWDGRLTSSFKENYKEFKSVKL